MGVAEAYTSVRQFVADRPLMVVAAVVCVVLLADLIAGLQSGRILLTDVITKAWDGVVIGLAIGLAGIGLSMTYSILGFANFSHGDYVTAGAFAGWSVTYLLAGFGTGNLGYLLLIGPSGMDGPSSRDLAITVISTPLAVLAGLVIAAAATILLALLLDRIVYRPMRDQGSITLLIASIGVALVVRYLIVLVFGGSNRGLTATTAKLVLGFVDGRFVVASVDRTIATAIATGSPPPDAFYWAFPLLDVGDYSSILLNVTSHELALVVGSLLLMLGVHLLLQQTKLGKAMRAMADNESLARVSGIPTERVVRATWIIGGCLAGAAGYLIALERGTLSFNLGWILLLLIFAAVILGGIGSIYGAMIGGLIIGVSSRLALVWIPPDFATATAFGVMILVLLFRPEGLFGGVTTA